jgi:Flp pilus assembly protein TadG
MSGLRLRCWLGHRRRCPGTPGLNRAGERGALTTELAVIMFPFLVGCLALVVFAGRVAEAEGDVQSAAQEAARAATLTGDPVAAETMARSVATANLATARVDCARGIAIQVDATAFNPGGLVTVTVTCTADFSDIAYLKVPGSRAFTATATEVVDVYRSENP